MVCNTAVFYDIENLIGLFSARNNTIIQMDEIYRRIQEVEGVSGVSVQKAYADWAVQINRNLKNYVLQIGIEPVQIFNTNQNDKVKNAADVSLIIDAVELLAKRPDIENYVIVSGDGIFAFLAKKLHEHGKRVIGCGFNRNTNIIFRNACDYFISLEKTDRTLTATSNKSVLNGPSAVAAAPHNEETAAQEESPAAAPAKPIPAAPVKPASAPAAQPVPTVKPASAPAAQPVPTAKPAAVTATAATSAATPKQPPAAAKPTKIPNRFPKNKFSEALSHANIHVWKNAADHNGALLVIRDVVNTLFEGVPDESADLEISVFKTYVDFYVQGFKMTQYKFKRFGEFMRFVLTGSPFCLYASEGNTLKIARRGTVNGKGSVLADMRGLQITLPDGKRLQSLFDVPGQSPFTYTIVELVKLPAKRETKANDAKQNADMPKAADTPQSTATEDVAEKEQTKEQTVEAEQTAEAAPKKTAAVKPAKPRRVKKTTDASTSKPSTAKAVLLDGSDMEDTADTVETQESEDGENDEGSIRKWIKSNFMRLSLENMLAATEVKRLLTVEYSQKTFGIKTPVLKEVFTRSNLREQRMANGKIKYWKELFKYNGKTYLIYKEWIATLHRDRFNNWLKRVESKQAKTK